MSINCAHCPKFNMIKEKPSQWQWRQISYKLAAFGGFVFVTRFCLYWSNQKEPKIAKFSKKSAKYTLTMMSNYEINFLSWIHILNFKYVWNLPSLSLAWFFFNYIEFRTMCVTFQEELDFLITNTILLSWFYGIWSTFKMISPHCVWWWEIKLYMIKLHIQNPRRQFFYVLCHSRVNRALVNLEKTLNTGVKILEVHVCKVEIF